jgi:hypothetical protein
MFGMNMELMLTVLQYSKYVKPNKCIVTSLSYVMADRFTSL